LRNRHTRPTYQRLGEILTAKPFQSVIAAFGQSAKAKLTNAAIAGALKDQFDETTLAHSHTRPGYAVSVNNAL
jgi:hypothetical protein